MRVDLPHIYSQFDGQWAKKILGNNSDPKYDFYNYGCLMASYAMALRYFNVEETPASLNDKLIAVAGFPPNSGLYVWGSVSKIYPQIIEKHTVAPTPLTDAQVLEIKQALDAGFPVMLGIDYNPKTLAADYHFVLAVDYNEKDENDITIVDPLGGRKHSLKDYLGFWKPSARKSIESYTVISGPLLEKPVAVTLEVKPVTQPQAQPTSPLPDNYGAIIGNSSKWDEIVRKYAPELTPENANIELVLERIKASMPQPEAVQPQDTNENWKNIVSYLELDKNPEDATFDNVKRVIAGIKSRQTDFEKQKNKALENEGIAQVTIVGMQEDISRINERLITEQKLHKAELDALKQSRPNFDSLQSHYRGVIKQQETTIDNQGEEIKRIRVDNVKKVIEDSVRPEGPGELVAESMPSKSGRLNLFEILKKFIIINK